MSDHAAVPEQSPTGSTESLSGLIERVTYFNEDNGYAILKVKVKGMRDLVTVVGSLPSVSPGEWLVAEGDWQRDRLYGMQFRARLLKNSPPSTPEGMVKYLGSGMMKGIGPVYARKMVERYGEEIFDIIESRSAQLEEIDGIGPQRRRRIKEAWEEQRVVRDIMLFLHSQGVSTSRSVRIYKTYGEHAVERVRENPYDLARDIRGIGFQSADTIASNVGIPPNSLIRARAGSIHVLQQAASQGHCALPAEMLLLEAEKLLEVEASLLQEALDDCIRRQELIRCLEAGQDLIYLPHLRAAEEGIAFRLRCLLSAPLGIPPIQVEKAIQWSEEKTGMKLADSQKEALRRIVTSKVTLLTGGPGVGKTTLVNSVLKILRAKKVKCLLGAPTGRAAKRLTETTGLPARTIHRMLESRAEGGGFVRNEERPLDCDLLVVDETSMMDVTLMHHLLRALKPSTHLLLVGDVDQLPSVGPGMVLADLIASGAVPVVQLREVFRQAASSWIIANAHRINQGVLPEVPGNDPDADFFFIEREEPEEIAEVLQKLVGERLPRKYGLDAITDIQVLAPMNQGTLGVRELNARLQKTLNPGHAEATAVEKFGWKFREGDKVIQTENNYDKEVFNGDIGQVSQILTEEKEVRIRFDHREVVYEFGELDEVSLAYAITIHKSQGSEFPVVVVPLAMQHYLLLQRNLIYTAVTRGKKLVVLVGQKKALAMAVRNNDVARRYSGLRPLLAQGGA